MKKTLLSLFFILVNTSVVTASDKWNATTLYQTNAEDLTISVVQFQKGEQQLLYQPSQPPYGVIDTYTTRLGGNDYIVTTWAHGARSVMFRVFAPDIKQEKPLCESISFAESTTLRLDENQQLEINVQLDSAIDASPIEPIWEPCTTPVNAKK